MKQAEKFHRPIICFVDTPGAACGIGAEERGQGRAIAENLSEMSGLKVPVLSIVIGEGGSGGALALAVANEVWMMENATYSILSPVIEWIVPEVEPAQKKNLEAIAETMKEHMLCFLKKQEGKSEDQLAMERYERFRRH